MPPRVTLLLGKPPRAGTLLGEVADDLVRRGWSVTVRLPHEETVDAADLTGETLVVHRGLRGSALIGAAHDRGVPLCNPWSGDLLLRDRRAWRAALDGAGIPLPPSTVLEQWPGVLAHAAADEVVAKVPAGPGRGARVVAGTSRTLPRVPPFPGPYLVEPRLRSDGTDRKLYVAGGSVRGLLKPSTLENPHTTSGTPFRPELEHTNLALRVGQALGAHLLGVDLLHTPAGPVVVDVNAFPGFRGVAGAASLVARHLVTHTADSDGVTRATP